VTTHRRVRTGLDVPGFTGRAAELAALSEATTVVISALSGTAGVGKTALAVHWAHRARDRFPGGQLYVDLRGYGPEQPTDPADALAGILREFGVDSADLPTDVSARYGVWSPDGACSSCSTTSPPPNRYVRCYPAVPPAPCW
jgi:hypothetical protein